MTNRTIQRLSGFCVLGLAVALNVAPIRGQNNPTQTPRNPQTPQTQPQQQQPGARGSSSTTQSATGQMSPSMFLNRAIEMNSAEIQISRLAQSKTQNDRVESYAQMLIKDHTAAIEKMQRLQGTQTSSTGTRQQPSTSSTDTAGTRSTTPSTGTPGTTGTPGAPGVPQTGQSGTRSDDRDRDTAQGGTRTQGTPDPSMPAISDEHRQLLTRLNGLSGSEFDREYINAMVSSHREAIRMFEQQAGVSPSTSSTQGTGATRQGATANQDQAGTSTQQQRDSQGPGSAQRQTDDTRSTTSSSTQGPSATEVAALARELLPTLRQHLEQAEQIQKTLK